jgi:hypothetical protein
MCISAQLEPPLQEKGQNGDNRDVSRFPKGEPHKKLTYGSIENEWIETIEKLEGMMD